MLMTGDNSPQRALIPLNAITGPDLNHFARAALASEAPALLSADGLPQGTLLLLAELAPILVAPRRGGSFDLVAGLRTFGILAASLPPAQRVQVTIVDWDQTTREKIALAEAALLPLVTAFRRATGAARVSRAAQAMFLDGASPREQRIFQEVLGGRLTTRRGLARIVRRSRTWVRP